MSEKLPRNLDAALAALARAERAARPRVSPDLRARVLLDAAEVAAELSAERPAAAARTGRARARREGGGRAGLLDRFRALDLWAGAAVAAALLCLVIGLGIGYGAGDSVLAGTGLGAEVRVAQADEGDGLFLGEDVL